MKVNRRQRNDNNNNNNNNNSVYETPKYPPDKHSNVFETVLV